MNNNIFQGYLYRIGWKKAGPFGVIGQFWRDLRCCWQRVTQGYCERDVWEMDVWMLNMLPDMLEHLQKRHIGHPGVFADAEDGDEQWAQLLGEMARLFRDANEQTCTRKNPHEAEWEKQLEHWNPNREQTELDKRYFDEECKLAEYRNDCKDQAFVLLSKWFFDLWD